MRSFLLSFIFFISSLSFCQVTISPQQFSTDDSITITININATTTNCNGFNNPSKVYMHSGIGTESNPWAYNVIGNWGQDDGIGLMTANGDGTWSITITPNTYFDLTSEQAANATKMGMVFRNEDGSQEFKATDCKDFLFDVGSFQLNLINPTKDPVILNSGASISISANTSTDAFYSLLANESLINTSSTASTSYTYNYMVNENTSFTLEAVSNGETKSLTFEAFVNPGVIEESIPVGMLEGINIDPNDPTKATLVLYAPMKEFVHVIGDFNDWQVDNSYLMKKDSSKDLFWIELTGLTPQFNHLYQYLVEYEINIADPYSTIILDEYNDPFINDITYPNLPAYPTGATTEAVTLLRTGDPVYNWQSTNFQKPAKTDLMVYELHLRDFDELHSFDAVKDRLDYLQKLGINAIELMPVNEFDGNESWGYNPSFHMALDKYYGTPTAFKQFIDECHTRGMAVIIDVVYNHATGQNPYFRLWNDSNGGLEGNASAENPFFNQEATHAYAFFNDFNHQTDATRRYVERTTKYWIEEYKVDGFRWDLTKGFTQNCTNDENCTNSYNQDRVDVLKLYADFQWEIDPDFYIIFEHLGIGTSAEEEEEWANYRFDEGKGIMLWNKLNPEYNEATMGYHENGKSDFSAVSFKVKNFPGVLNMSYMESHDEERLMFKNLAYGNSGPDHNITQLSTALDRLKLAGAFFFTVPGPKMIWQFGELGYDYSIDFNGRVGNKPIRWDYFEDPERKAIYDLWSKLIKLKLNEPIFKTLDFKVDSGRDDGLKSIHLKNSSTEAGAISFVTIIGNFGVTTQNIDPEFQEAGVWYEFLNENSKHIVSNTTDPIALAPGEFRIYGNNPSALFPNSNPPDEDSDGVLNTDDLCPNTTLGATVDINGCEIFTLPNTNFKIMTTSETCRDANNGKIEVTTEEVLPYSVSLIGNGLVLNESFNTSWSAEALASGSYYLCFTVDGEADYEQCFTVVITEPDDLSVQSQVNTKLKLVSLNLSGGDRYQVTVNGITQETDKEQLTVSLKEGENRISVTTGIDCQGVYEDLIYVSPSVSYYPNPVIDEVTVLLTTEDSKTDVSIHSIDGRQVYKKTQEISPDNSIKIPASQLAPGHYLIVLKGKSLSQTIKIIKQ
ncbi:DUF4961 domain-containing protein [Zhouia amylolytica]|nr:alpha-amylase family glycosyl hydrolase [Zhouia amylolytica]